MRHASTATSTGPVSSLSYLSKENGRIPKAFRTCPFCNGCGMVEHDTLARPATTNSSISDGEVASIRRLHAAGMSGYRIAQIFPASYGAIKAYIRGDRRRAKDS